MASLFSSLIVRRPREPEPVADDPSTVEGLQRWIAETTAQARRGAHPPCGCHEPPQPMRWHKDARRSAGGYYECPLRVAEARRRRVYKPPSL
jgi:hypothetical protein